MYKIIQQVTKRITVLASFVREEGWAYKHSFSEAYMHI